MDLPTALGIFSVGFASGVLCTKLFDEYRKKKAAEALERAGWIRIRRVARNMVDVDILNPGSRGWGINCGAYNWGIP